MSGLRISLASGEGAVLRGPGGEILAVIAPSPRAGRHASDTRIRIHAPDTISIQRERLDEDGRPLGLVKQLPPRKTDPTPPPRPKSEPYETLGQVE